MKFVEISGFKTVEKLKSTMSVVYPVHALHSIGSLKKK